MDGWMVSIKEKKMDDKEKKLNDGVYGSLSEEEVYHIRDWLMERNENIMIPTGHENAVIGVVTVFPACDKHDHILAVLDREKGLENYRTEMDPEEAEEWFGFNTLGAYVGTGTPAYFERYEKE